MNLFLNRIKSMLWAPVKARIQEKKIEKELLFYDQKAWEKNIHTEDVYSEKYTRQKLNERLKNKIIQTKQKGSLNILYITPYDYWERINIPAALSRFGKLSIYDMGAQGFRVLEHDYLRDWLTKRHTFDEAISKYVKELHSKTPVDVIISYVSGWHIHPDSVKQMNDLGIITVAFWLDDRYKFRGRLEEGRYEGAASLAPVYDLNLTSASDSLVKYFVEGGLALFWPEAANPEHFQQINLPFMYDVSFIGARYGGRGNYIKYLKQNGIRIDAFGPGWDNGMVSPDEMIRIYNQSRINLGFGGIGYSMKETCLKGRDFEVPMCGTVYLTSHDKDLPKVYEIGREIFTYTSKEDMLDKVKYLLANEDLCARVRIAARERCLKDHTWEKRFEYAFRQLGILE